MNLCLEGQKMHLAYKNLKTCSSYLTKRSSSDPAKITVETATSIYWPFFPLNPSHLVPFPLLVPLGIIEQVFTGLISLLTPSNQCQCTDGRISPP